MSENDAVRQAHDTNGVAYSSETVAEDVTGDPDVVACSMNEAEVERRREWVHAELLPPLEEVIEIPDGFTLVFEGTDEALGAVMKFVHLESRCCSHVTFEIEVSPGAEPTTLTLSGSEEAKELTREGFVSRIPEEYRSANAGERRPNRR